MSENLNTNNEEGGRQQQQVYKENTSTSSSSSPPTPKPEIVEEQRPEDSGLLRQHERHILFHFFTLFSISFVVGVLIIHLSLWINANYLSSVATTYNNDNSVVTNTLHHVTTSSATQQSPDYDDYAHDEKKKNDVTSNNELNLWFEPVRLTPALYDIVVDGGTGGGVKVIVNSWNMTSSTASRMFWWRHKPPEEGTPIHHPHDRFLRCMQVRTRPQSFVVSWQPTDPLSAPDDDAADDRRSNGVTTSKKLTGGNSLKPRGGVQQRWSFTAAQSQTTKYCWNWQMCLGLGGSKT